MGGCKPASLAWCRGRCGDTGSGSPCLWHSLTPGSGCWDMGGDAGACGGALAHPSPVTFPVSCPSVVSSLRTACPLHPSLPALLPVPARLCRCAAAPTPGRSAAPRAVWGQLRDECEHIVWAPAAGVTVSLLESQREPQPRRDKRLQRSRRAHAGAAGGLGCAVAPPASPMGPGEGIQVVSDAHGCGGGLILACGVPTAILIYWGGPPDWGHPQLGKG